MQSRQAFFFVREGLQIAAKLNIWRHMVGGTKKNGFYRCGAVYFVLALLLPKKEQFLYAVTPNRISN